MKKHLVPHKSEKDHFPFSQEKNAQGEFYCASQSEMTGLVPSGNPDKDERDHYQHIFPYLPSGSDGTPA